MVLLRQLVSWLGPVRARLLVTALVGAALGSLGIQLAFAGEDWALPVQIALVWLLFGALALVLGSRLPPTGRRRLALALGPGLILLGLGVLVPDMVLFFGGAGLGWMVTAQFVLRGRVRMEYQTAIRHLRQGEYDAAIAVMNELVETEPNAAEHHRFRAEIFRLAGRLPQAIVDYRRMIALDPQAATGYTGLAEVYAQQGDFEQAREYAVQALERDPRHWMTAYNLGLIADRLADARRALEALEHALAAGIPHSRYRLLAHLWLARNHRRLDQPGEATHHLDRLRREVGGLREWALVFQSEQAAPLRAMLEDDVQLAQRLIDSDESPDSLGET